MARRLSRLALAATLCLSACAPAQTQLTTGPAAEAVVQSHEFQRDYDAELKSDPTSFVTTVAAYYLAPGDALELARSEVGWIEESPKAPPALALQAAADGLVVRFGGELHRFEDSDTLELDERYSLAISRQELDWRVLIHDRQAPSRAEFAGVDWYPVDAAFIVVAQYEPRPTREPMLLQTSRGLQKTLYVAGEAEFTLAGTSASLLVFAYGPDPSPAEPMLIPFRDATSGEQTYAAGRYLEVEAPGGAQLILDFNRATNPLCAYSEHYNCPMPPRFNVLDVAIEAGAKSPH